MAMQCFFILLVCIFAANHSNTSTQGESDKETTITTPTTAIESVLVRNHKILADAPEFNNNSDIAEVIKHHEYITTKLNKIDLSLCPDDFARAFRKYCFAWSDRYQVFLDFKRMSGPEAALTGFLMGLAGQGAEYVGHTVSESQSLFKKAEAADKALRDTYQEVLDIASKHGVNTSKYR